MTFQSIITIYTVIIPMHLYNYTSHFPRHIMYYCISSHRRGWCLNLDALTTCYSFVTLLYNISINVYSLFGSKRKTTFTRLCCSPISFIIFNQLIYVHVIVVNLEMGNKYPIISYVQVTIAKMADPG